MSKTIKEWFEQLPPDVRENAIANTAKHVLHQPADSLFMAINNAFVWADTPQGHEYWQAIYNGAESVFYENTPEQPIINTLEHSIDNIAVRLGMAIGLLEGWAYAMQQTGLARESWIEMLAKRTDEFVKGEAMK